MSIISTFPGGSGGGGSSLPPGGTTDQVLAKASNNDGDVKWADPTGGESLPDGGVAGQVLTKLSDADGDAGWADPTGGGEPGVGIDSVTQTTTSTESGGENVVTVTKTDGTTAGTFKVYNGKQGFSPEITENAGNGDLDYRLNVTTEAGAFTTPNLKTPTVHTVSDGSVYSTEEMVIGTWIDGKPLYRRTVLSQTASTGNTITTLFSVSDWNVDVFTRIDGVWGGTTLGVPLNCPEAAASHYVSSDKTFKSKVASIHANSPLVTTLEYTKTTDTATIAIATAEELNNAYNEGVQSA